MTEQKRILIRALEMLQGQKQRKRWRRAVAGMAAAVIFATTSLLTLPAITLNHGVMTMDVSEEEALLGENIYTDIYAEASDGRSETWFYIEADGYNAGLDERQIDFDSDGAALIWDDEDQEIELWREIDEDGTVGYWFMLEEGQSVRFTLPWMNGADRCHTEEVRERIAMEDLPGASIARHDVPLVMLSSTATSSDAESESGSGEKPENGAEEKPESGSGQKPEDEPEKEPAPVVRDKAEYIRYTETVIDQEGDPDREGMLTLVYGCGTTLKRAQRKANDTVELFWVRELGNSWSIDIPEGATSWATVTKRGFIATASDAVVSDATASDAAAVTATASDGRRVPVRAWSMSFSEVSLSEATDGAVDFGERITGVKVSIRENGQWVEKDEFVDGDSVQISIDYTLKAGEVTSGQRVIYYQLPEGISLGKEASGVVFDGGNEVGTYTITEDGRIEIHFNENFAQDGKAFNGNITFEGIVSRTGDGEEGEIKFGNGTTITVRAKTDIKIEKSGSYDKENRKLNYQLTVSTENGTGDMISVKDGFYTSDISTAYDKDSFKVVKIGADGTKKELSKYEYKLEIKPQWDGGPEGFEITGLPKLEKGEKYEITYTAEPTLPENSNGSLSVGNSAAAEDQDGNKGNTSSNIEISRTMISKYGTYDQNTDLITWTITIGQEGQDISGYTLKDTLTTIPEGIQVQLPSDVPVTLRDKNGEQSTIKLPYTFPENSRLAPYTVTYSTKAEGIKPGEQVSVKNKAELDKDGEHYEQESTVWPSKQGYGVSKRAEGTPEISGEDNKYGIYKWVSEITVPDSGVTLEQITYTDTLSDVCISGNPNQPVEDSHYVTPGMLLNEPYMLSVSIGNVTLQRGTDYDVYAREGDEPLTADGDEHLDGFRIEFKEPVLEKLAESEPKPAKIKVTYYTRVDYEKLTETDVSYSIKNKGSIPGHDSEASTEWKRNSKLQKQASVSGDPGSFKDSQIEIDAKENGGLIHYRLLIRTDAKTDTGDIYISDILPEGVVLVEDSIKLTGNNGNDWWESPSYNNGSYVLQEHIHLESKTEKPDGTTTVKFKIDAGYSADGMDHTMALYYDVSVTADPRWTESPNFSEWIYTNKASWGEYEDSVDARVEYEGEKLIKEGEQLPQYDENGEVQLDSDGNPLYTNTIRYRITVNPGGQDLVPGKDELTLIDTLTIPQTASGAEFIVGSVHIYEYDAEAENSCGQEISPARYRYIYDSDRREITFTIPDSLGMVLVYEYTIDRGTAAGDLTIGNSAELSGTWKIENNTEFHEIKSSATATKRVLTVYKVDGQNYGISLPGAVFKLESYDVSSKRWSSVGTVTTNDEGYLTITAGNGGEDEDEDNTQMSCQSDTLYRMTETEAPPGYAKDDTVYYLVWVASSDTEEACRQKMADILKRAGVAEADVEFISGSSAIYVPNEPTRLTVQKVWVDDEGSEFEPSGNMEAKVTLYRQTGTSNARTVTVISEGNASWANPYTENIQVAKGSSLTIEITGVWTNSLTVKIGDKQEDIERSSDQKWTYTIPEVSDDMEVHIYPTDSTVGNSFEQISFSGYIKPSFEGDGEKEKVGDTVVLNEENQWSYSWDNLPKTNDSGEPYFYTVEETAVPGYSIIYSSNNASGIQTGELMITNKAAGYVLPETGGPGRLPFTAGGLAAFAAAALMYINNLNQKGKDGLRK